MDDVCHWKLPCKLLLGFCLECKYAHLHSQTNALTRISTLKFIYSALASSF